MYQNFNFELTLLSYILAQKWDFELDHNTYITFQAIGIGNQINLCLEQNISGEKKNRKNIFCLERIQ